MSIFSYFCFFSMAEHHQLFCVVLFSSTLYVGTIFKSEPRELPHFLFWPNGTPLSGHTANISPVSTDGHAGSFQYFPATMEATVLIPVSFCMDVGVLIRFISTSGMAGSREYLWTSPILLNGPPQGL